jgi:hypothetical protein
MITRSIRFLKSLRSHSQLAMAMGRAAATAPLRNIDPTQPDTWEFRAFSQHGEDGVLDYLTSRLLKPSKNFVEIGIGDGTENNSAWFALAHYYRGTMIDGSAKGIAWARYLLQNMNYGLSFEQCFVTVEEIQKVIGFIEQPLDPDFFSLDIDGNDYWIAKALLEGGVRPKIWVVEYNSALGPERALTIPYQTNFVVTNTYGNSLYLGCSISAWLRLMGEFGYRFVTVESSGTNALFVEPSAFSPGFLAPIQGTKFGECFSHRREYGVPWPEQFKLIEHYDWTDVERNISG